MRREGLESLGSCGLALALLAVAAGGAVAGEAGGEPRLVPVKIDLPIPLFRETPKQIRFHDRMEKPSGKLRPPFLAPEGTRNVALNKPVAGSDENPLRGELPMATDGDKSSVDGAFVELAEGRQWVQIDLQSPCAIYALVLWHYHGEARVYHDVVIQTADDPDFILGVRTLFNSDFDNSAGLGLGKDLEYLESFEGKLIPVKDTVARYLRLYSQGNTTDRFNHYAEVEVYGKPAK